MDTAASEAAVWVVVGVLVGVAGAAFWHRLGGASVAVADTATEPPTRVAPKPKNPARAAAARKVMKDSGWHDRYRCEVCGLESTKGGVGKHHAASGHTGRVKVDD